MALGHSPSVVMDGLIFNIDAGNTRSYSGSGVTINCLAGGLGGALINGAGFTSTNSGLFFFDGIDDHIDIPFSGTGISCLFNNFTISFLARPFFTITASTESTSGAAGIAGKRYIVEPTYSDIPNAAGWGVALGTNVIEVLEHTAGHLPVLLSYSANITGINHFTVVSNNKTPLVYINGNLVRTGITSTKNFTTFYLSSNLGGFIYGYNPCYILNYSIYNRALSAQEILQNYNATKGRYGL
jgi:hypothetical protein